MAVPAPVTSTVRPNKICIANIMTNEQIRISPVLEAIFKRRSIRRYHADPVPRELVTSLLEAAQWAPSAHNRQPWRFVVIETQAEKERLAVAMGARLRRDLEADGVPAEVIDKDVSRSYDRLTSAPILVVLCLSMGDMDSYPDANRYTDIAHTKRSAVRIADDDADFDACAFA